jgi:predicted lipoprotein with Yx(FWY)xxD motif
VTSVNRARSCAAIATVIGLLVAGCAQTVATSKNLGQAHDTALGPVLVAPDGMTLYTYDKDGDGISNCSGFCAVAWPPLLADDNAEATDSFTVIARSGGDPQWAYNRQPLYLYIGDSKPGDVDGDGVDGVWHVARP